jgi:hypothetical protein
MGYTLADLATYCGRHGWTDQTTDGVVQLKAWINDMIQLLASAREWPFYRKIGYLNLKAPYSTGMVTVTNASAAVTGSGTAWSTTGDVGQEFVATEDANRVYQTAAVASTTALTLEQAYLGAGGAGKAYELRYVRYAAAADLDYALAFYLEQDGRELGYGRMGLDAWHQARMVHRATAAWPTDVVYHGTNVDGTGYFYIHPAPAEAKGIRYSYYQKPVLATDSVAPDWPERFRYLLHTLLRTEVATKGRDGTTALELGWFQNLVEAAWLRSQDQRGPVSITPPGQSRRMSVAEFESMFNIAP